MREHLPEDRSPHFRVWGRPALPGPPGSIQAARPSPDSFRRAVARQRSSLGEHSTSGGAAPIRVDLSREASSSLPFHSLPSIPEPRSRPWHRNPRPELHNLQPWIAPPLLLHQNPSRAKVWSTAFGSSSQSLWPTPSRRRHASGPMPRPVGLGEAAQPPHRTSRLQLARRHPPNSLYQGAMG